MSARVLRPVARWIDDRNASLGVLESDVLAADLRTAHPGTRMRAHAEGPLTVNWVTTPPGAGSGGHMTTFRMVSYLASRGHRCRIYLYDVYGGTVEDHERTIRDHFPAGDCEIFDVRDGMADADAVFATSWPTAYAVFNDACAGKRYYFVQDFEPWFFGRGAQATLADNTYRMGFHAVTAGRWLAGKLADEYGMPADSFDFGCDVARYHVLPGAERKGIAFYARRDVSRRAYELGILALQLFAQARPDLEIHLYGEKVGRLPFPFVDHGLVRVEQLNEIYNRCFAALSLSMSNVSLVPYEMLAAGCVPVVNDADHNRVVLDNPFVQYADATPHALAQALVDVVERPDFERTVPDMVASVRSASWADAGAKVESVLCRDLS